jgi:hypothetical protein
MAIIINPSVQQATLAINANTFGGSLPNGINNSLIELKYSYPAFNQDSLSNYTKGELVVFKEDSSASKNAYSTLMEKASTGTIEHANKNLMIFISYSNGVLTAMHKGYLDFEDTNGPLSSWSVGRSLYVNGTNIGINPSGSTGSWVKSIGFCMPNSDDVKRIWFEPDSTYLILQ